MLEKRENGNCWIQEEGIDDGYSQSKIGGQESRQTNMCTCVESNYDGASNLFFDGKNAGDMIR